MDDNQLNREILREILTDHGLAVEEAGNGSEAVTIVAEREPAWFDFILMDIQMPHMNGYEATKKIRALDDAEKANLPIIAMTANAFEEDKQNAYKAGMNGHIAKPIDVDKLFETLAEVLKTGR